MELIDADAMREYFKISKECVKCHWNNKDCSLPPYYSLRDICSAIDEIPTVDAVPVVHGRWVYEHSDPAMIPCSVCGYQVFRYNNTHYCPNCGAKMDADQHLAFVDQSGAEYADNPTV